MATFTFRVIPMGVRRGLWRYSEWQLLVALFLVGDVKIWTVKMLRVQHVDIGVVDGGNIDIEGVDVDIKGVDGMDVDSGGH